MLANKEITEPFLAVFTGYPDFIYLTDPIIFERSWGTSQKKIKKNLFSILVTKNGDVYEIANIEIFPRSTSKILTYFLKKFDLQVYVRKLNWSFSETKQFLSEKIRSELSRPNPGLDTEEPLEVVMEKISDAKTVSEIFDIIEVLPDDASLTRF